MRKISGLYSRFAILVLLMALLAACGNKGTTIASTTTPVVYFYHSVAFNNGAIFAWGANTYGQLGNNDTTGVSVLVPQAVVGLPATGMAGVSAGGTHTLAFKNNSSVYAWGNNGYGQLGINSTTASPVPLQVAKYRLDGTPESLSGIIAVSAGFSHSLALDSNKNVWAWGDNTYGQLGDGTVNGHYAAVPVLTPGTGSPLTGVSRIFAGGGHSLALMSNGTVMSWGYNGFGQLGNKVVVFNNISTGSSSSVPNAVVQDNPTKSLTPTYPNLTNVTDFAAGGSHSLFIVNDGVNPATLWVCGYNFRGQLGIGNITDKNHGVVRVDLSAVPGGGVPIQVAAGLDHSLVLMSSGRVFAWGLNYSGQVGNNAALTSITPVMTPVPVVKDANNTPLSHVTKIMAIGNTSFAIVNTGSTPATATLWTWGDNTFGQLGLGDTVNRSYATQVTSLSSGVDLYHP